MNLWLRGLLTGLGAGLLAVGMGVFYALVFENGKGLWGMSVYIMVVGAVCLVLHWLLERRPLRNLKDIEEHTNAS